jgi:hypothetical protein
MSESSYVRRSTSLWVTCPECKAHMQSKPRLIAKLTEEAKLQGKRVREVAIAYFDTYHLAAHRYEPTDLDSGKDPW